MRAKSWRRRQIDNSIETINKEKEDVMAAIYFGFAFSDSMFGNRNVTLHRRVVSADMARELITEGPAIPCLNSSHVATIDAMKARYGIDVAIPLKPPSISLQLGDRLLLLAVSDCHG